MNPEEFARRLSNLPEVEPDKIDLAMLEEAEEFNDETTVSFEEFNRGLNERAGRILRIPHSLRKTLQ